MSSIIFQAADKRVMMPHSSFMFHEGTLTMDGTRKQVKHWMKWNDKNDHIMFDIYIKKMREKGKFSRWSKKRIKDMLIDSMNKKEDVFLTAEETVHWGLADEIFGANGLYDWTKLTVYSEEQLAQ